MDKYGNLYLDENAPEEDQKRAEEWGKELEEKEIQRQIEKIKEFERVKAEL